MKRLPWLIVGVLVGAGMGLLYFYRTVHVPVYSDRVMEYGLRSRYIIWGSFAGLLAAVVIEIVLRLRWNRRQRPDSAKD